MTCPGAGGVATSASQQQGERRCLYKGKRGKSAAGVPGLLIRTSRPSDIPEQPLSNDSHHTPLHASARRAWVLSLNKASLLDHAAMPAGGNSMERPAAKQALARGKGESRAESRPAWQNPPVCSC